MCRILQPAAENLVYHYRFGDDDDLDNIALDLGRYLDKDRKQLPEDPVHSSDISRDGGAVLSRLMDRTANVDVRMPDPGSLINLPPNVDECEEPSSALPGRSLPPPYEDVVQAGSPPLQTHERKSPDISTAALEGDADAGLVRTLERTDCPNVDMTGSLPLHMGTLKHSWENRMRRTTQLGSSSF
jgi:hypothetical protein